MSDTTTGGSSSGSSTVSGGSGGSTAPAAPAAPAYAYVVTQPGNGFEPGTLITDAATISSLNLATARWVVRINASEA
jgi:hypothetical protein